LPSNSGKSAAGFLAICILLSSRHRMPCCNVGPDRPKINCSQFNCALTIFCIV